MKIRDGSAAGRCCVGSEECLRERERVIGEEIELCVALALVPI